MSRPSTESSSAPKSYSWLFPHEHPLHHMNSYGTVQRPASPVPEVKADCKTSTRKRALATSPPSTPSSTSQSYNWLFPHEHPLHHVNSYGTGNRPACPIPEVEVDSGMSTRQFVKAVLRRIVVVEV